MIGDTIGCPNCGMVPDGRSYLRALQGEGPWLCESCVCEDHCNSSGEGQGEWSSYPLGREGHFQGRYSFSSVWHVTHMESALGIIRDGAINTKSTHQTLFGWWAGLDAFQDGSRFGNIAFELNFHELFDKKHVHWSKPVDGAMPRFRFTISDREWIEGTSLYNPATDDRRPWYWDRVQDKHFARGIYKYGFFFDQKIVRANWKAVRFIDHHPRLCSRTPNTTCADLGMSQVAARTKFEQLLRMEGLDSPEVLALIH